MSKLCLGTFFKAIIRCKIKSRTITQKSIVGDAMRLIDSDFDESDDSMISNIAIGHKNPSIYVMETVNKIKEEEFDKIIEGFKKICLYIDPNRYEECRCLICYIIENDDSIHNDTIVEMCGRVKKDKLRTADEPLEEFLAGIFIYSLKYTDNKESKQFVNEIINVDASLYMTQSISSSCDVKNDKQWDVKDVSEETWIEAQHFCLKHEEEIDLLPLCQIAFDVDSLHSDVREIYKDYKLCNSKVRKMIMDIKSIPLFDFSDKKWKLKCIDKYNKQVFDEGLTTKEFLYEGAKYFHRAYKYYSRYEIEEFNPRIFDRPFKGKSVEPFLIDNLTSLSFYISDFYWYKNKFPDHYIEPPMDYIWKKCNLMGCSESEVTYWVCKFIIDSSYYMVPDGHPIDEKWENVHINDYLIKTQEDMYYYALLQLYWLYMIDRTNDN